MMGLVDYWTQERGWPDQKGPLRMRLTFGLVDGRPEVVGMELWGVSPAEVWGLTKREERKAGLQVNPKRPAAIHTETARVPLRRLLKEWRTSKTRAAEIAKAVKALPEPRRSAVLPPAYVEEAIATAEKVAHGHDRSHWIGVTDAYLDGGLAAVMDLFDVSKGTAGKWVWIARHRENLLKKTSRGARSGRT